MVAYESSRIGFSDKNESCALEWLFLNKKIDKCRCCLVCNNRKVVS